MTSFASLGLAPPLLAALAATGYTTPTPIQTQAIPPVLGGRDLCGIAQTGTGKTAAFALPVLQRLSAAERTLPQSCRVLVLSPTRELASQIALSFATYGAHMPFSTAVVFGGVPIARQRRQLARGVDILVATPGRLLDLIDNRFLSLSQVRVLILDEADRMLDLGFVPALRRIVKLLPTKRQTLLFSATMPKSIATLAEQYLDDPVRVVVAPPATTAERVDQSVVFVAAERKREVLAALLRDPAFERVLVFTRTKHGADRVVHHLVGGGIEAAVIHGNKSQPQRERALESFRAGRARVLVATDIAARGIDVDGVSHVINFELPNVPEDYVHRIGRTARAGAPGAALSLCGEDERPYLRAIEKLTRTAVRVIAGSPAAADAAAPRPERMPASANGHARATPPTPARPAQMRPAQARPAQDRPASGHRQHSAAPESPSRRGGWRARSASGR